MTKHYKSYSTRIKKAFTTNNHEQYRKNFIPYIMCGEYSLDTTIMQMESIAKYCKIIELGIPFSNPVADGQIIQESSKKSLQNKTKLQDVFNVIKSFRETNQETAIILMGYYNIIYSFGVERFADKMNKIGVDGLIICDLPFEESKFIYKTFNNYNIDLIQLVTNLTSKERMINISKISSGFVYFVGIAGVTGSKQMQISSIQEKLSEIRNIFNIPNVVGFGIDNQKTAQEIYKISDGVVVGSYLIDFFNKNCINQKDCYQIFENKLKSFVF